MGDKNVRKLKDKEFWNLFGKWKKYVFKNRFDSSVITTFNIYTNPVRIKMFETSQYHDNVWDVREVEYNLDENRFELYVVDNKGFGDSKYLDLYERKILDQDNFLKVREDTVIVSKEKFLSFIEGKSCVDQKGRQIEFCNKSGKLNMKPYGWISWQEVLGNVEFHQEKNEFYISDCNCDDYVVRVFDNTKFNI